MHRIPLSAILLLTATVLATGGIVNAQAQTQTPARVVVVRPQTGDVTQELRLAGSLDPYQRTELYAKVTGYVKEIPVDIGDRVRRGQVLAVIEVPEMEPDLAVARAEVAAAEARLRRAEADSELAVTTNRRVAAVRKQEPGAVTGQDLDAAAAAERVAAAEAASAGADLELAEAKLRRIEALLNYASITAPFSGTISRRLVDPGALVMAGDTSGGPILAVVRTDRLRLVLDIPEVAAPHVAPGTTLRFTVDALPGARFEGRLSRTAGLLRPGTRSMRAELDVDNSDGRLTPGMYATVHLELRNFANALSIPATAVRRDRGESFVLVADSGVLRKIPVSILLDDGATVVVSGALAPSSAVVVAGPISLTEGRRVTVEER